MKTGTRIIVFSLATLIFVVLALAAYVAFEFTLIPSIRESISDIDKTKPAEYGAVLFQTRGCAGCHRLSPEEAAPTLGPSLSGIAKRRSIEYIRESIINPRADIASGCEPAPCKAEFMPEYGDILDTEQIEALVKYLSQP